jgi:hypothetical protein
MSQDIIPASMFEKDYCRSMGIQPYIPGDILIATSYYSEASGDEYTVPAGKVLCLTGYDITFAILVNYVYIRILDLVPSTCHTLCLKYNSSADKTDFVHVEFSFPLILPAGYRINYIVVGPGSDIRFNYRGYLLPT